jgi:hypothetical protein
MNGARGTGGGKLRSDAILRSGCNDFLWSERVKKGCSLGVEGESVRTLGGRVAFWPFSIAY